MQFDAIGDAIDESAHAAFADLTGDRNPLHVDAHAARRLQFGERAVHGMHLVMRALATLEPGADLANVAGRRCARVRTRFLHSVPVGAALRAAVKRVGDDEWIVSVQHDVWTAVEVHVWMEPGAVQSPASLADDWPNDRQPLDRSGTAISESTGEVPSVRGQFDGPFGDIASDLLTLTRLVGMEMPGLHSIFSQFDVRRQVSIDATGTLRYAVTSFDERFGKVVIDVSGAVLAGTVAAFVRASPSRQQSPDEWSTRPEPREFEGQRALVVGGSRGLGEVTAQLLAAGGAQVTVAYRAGADDARRVVGALPGDDHSTIELDVTNRQHLAELGAHVSGTTHVYFFASPPIFRGMNGAYSDALFAEFRGVYVDAFDAVIEALDVSRLRGVMIPSSVVLNRIVGGMAEYTDAKRLAETAIIDLARRHPHLAVAHPRLPRLATDQTASQMPADTGDAVAELLPALRAVAGPARG